MKETKHFLSLIAALLLLITFNSTELSAQSNEEGKIIQFSGLIINAETLEPVIGVHIFSPKYGKGSTSDYFGKFSFPIKEGDSLFITAVGFEKQTYFVPFVDPEEDHFTTALELIPSATYLEEVNITSIPTEDLFKDAILAMNVSPSKDQVNLNKTTQFINSMQAYKQIPSNSGDNYNNVLATQELERQDNYQPRVYSPINPIAWVKLIRSLKKK